MTVEIRNVKLAEKYADFVENGGLQDYPPGVFKKFARIILWMQNARTVTELGKNHPGLKLHPLEGNRAGQIGGWVNDQYRVCFESHIAETGLIVENYIIILDLVDYYDD